MVKPKSLTVAWISSAYMTPMLLGVVPEGTETEEVKHSYGGTSGVTVGSIGDFIQDCISHHETENKHKSQDFGC